MDKKSFKKFRAFKIEDLVKDERSREESHKKRLDMIMKKSTAEEKLILNAQISMRNGVAYPATHEYPDRKATFSERLMMPLPMSSTELWIQRSYLNQDMESLRPRSNFQLDLFGKFVCLFQRFIYIKALFPIGRKYNMLLP